jgi:hypothetical protein
MPRCVFWNETSLQYSTAGCFLSGSSISSGRAVDCKCNHLTTFSTMLDSTAWITTLSAPHLEKNAEHLYWERRATVTLMAVLYLSVLAVLLITRLRRARQGYAFLQ